MNKERILNKFNKSRLDLNYFYDIVDKLAQQKAAEKAIEISRKGFDSQVEYLTSLGYTEEELFKHIEDQAEIERWRDVF